MMRSVGISAVAAASVMIVPPDSAVHFYTRMIEAISSAATAQDVYPFNSPNCPEQHLHRWCESKAYAQGWRLKYQSKSPDNIADASWDIEVWTRGHEVMLCEFRFSGRGGANINYCEPLREVA
jgi:hypothetical protein